MDFSACVNLTKIEQSTFEGCTGLTGTIVFPASLKEIDSSESHGAFRNCTDLTGADFSACTALIELEEYSFSGCSKLASIILPPNLTTIKEAVFAGCTNLANVTFPSSLTTIGNYAFADCNRLTTIVFSVHFPAIGDEAFSKHFLETLDLSACTDCTESDIQFFKKYSIETIKLPSNFTSISERPFAGFSRLLSLDFSACTGITEIASRAFISCHNIKNIVPPPNITTIGEEAFTYCKNLKSVDLSGCISLTKIDYRAFAECIEAEVVLPESITSITPGAFGGARIYEKNDLDCKKVKIKGGTQFNRIKALVIASYYSADRIEQY